MIRTIGSTVLAGALLLMSTMSTAQQPGMGMGMGGGHGGFTDPKVDELIGMTLERYLK